MPYGLTLNAIVSVLATAFQSSLINAVAGAISQLKWCHYTRKRKLLDIQDFDDASRGPWGSIVMHLNWKYWRSLASTGALITLLALAYGLFVQQILKYPVRQTQSRSDAAVVQKVSIFVIDPNGPRFTDVTSAGIWSDTDQFHRNPSCPSGNCSTYKSGSPKPKIAPVKLGFVRRA